MNTGTRVHKNQHWSSVIYIIQLKSSKLFFMTNYLLKLLLKNVTKIKV